MKLFCIFWALLMGLFALIQMNDPDPLAWTIVYLACCAIWIGEYFRVGWWWLNLALMLAMMAWAVVLSPALGDWFGRGSVADLFEGLRADRPYVEPVLEMLGLLLASGSLGVLVWLHRPRMLQLRISTGD